MRMNRTSSAFGEAAHSICCTAPTTSEPLHIAQLAPAGSLSEEQRRDVRLLHELIEGVISGDDKLPWRAEARAHMDDFTLMRFIASRPDSVDKALEMYTYAMRWRFEHRINESFCELHPCSPEPSARQRLARAHYFGGYGGTDRDGAPYFVLRVARADYAAFVREPRLAKLMLEADAVNLETVFRSVRAGSAATGSFVRAMVVVDAAGYSLGLLRHVGFIKAVMAVGPQVFPEGASQVLIVNVPRIFAAAWALVSPWLPQRSRDKVCLLSAAATPAALAERIDASELPRFLGGTRPEEETFVARAEPVPATLDLPDT